MATPLCKYFGKCGGCSFQHVDYSTQLDNKKNILIKSINYDDVQVFSDKEYYYRNRMDLIFHSGGIGFREKGAMHKIVDIERCVISNERLNELIKEVRDNFKDIDVFDTKKKNGTYRYVVIRTPSKESSISFVLNDESSKLEAAINKIKQFAQKTTATHVVITYVNPNTDMSISEEYWAIKGEEELKETYLDKEFYYSIQGFFQNNHVMAEKMQNYVNELLKKYDLKEKKLLDLYGGVGTFGIINSEYFKEVLIVESFQGSIDSANKNIQHNHITNAQAICLDAKNLKKLELPNKELVLITDPPRTGMDQKTIEEIKKIKPETIIYISCNVEQLGKDLIKLKDYKIRSAALFDLFPQTPHSEAIVELIKI